MVLASRRIEVIKHLRSKDANTKNNRIRCLMMRNIHLISICEKKVEEKDNNNNIFYASRSKDETQ